MACFCTLVILLLTAPGASQVVPPTWRKPNITTSRAERVGLAGAALDVAIGQLSSNGQFDAEPYRIAGDLFSQMAQFDIATNQTKYENTLEQYFAIVQKTRTNFSASQGLLIFWLMSSDFCIDRKWTVRLLSWWFGRQRTISQSDLSAGKIVGKNFTLKKVCQDATMVGGTFLNNQTTEPRVAGLATGYFLVLSALLAEVTSDPLYLQAASESANFIDSHLRNPPNIVQDFITTRADTGCEVVSASGPVNVGLMIEGLSILSSLTNNTSTQNLLSDLLVATIPNTGWQGDDGIVSVGGNGNLHLLQGLGTVYTRKSTHSTLRQYVGDYIAVQFNAVTDLATSSGTNIYGQAWTGPPSATFAGTNQTIALGALISAIGLETASSSLPTTPSSENPTLPSKSTNLARILGGTVGGLAFVALILAILWFLRRRRLLANQNSEARLQPFLIPTTLPIISRYGGKDRRRGPLAPSPRQFPSERMGSSPVNAPTISATGNRNPGNDLPTEHLVQLLNQRLQNHQWDEGETPPNYTAP
ncbi:hypothetical protein B0H13DRAFT_2529634 [Mycena leptocephala]|nr:hypothetical protein B0H13DRAFT_2529634 [Mycena leptocephala]